MSACPLIFEGPRCERHLCVTSSMASLLYLLSCGITGSVLLLPVLSTDSFVGSPVTCFYLCYRLTASSESGSEDVDVQHHFPGISPEESTMKFGMLTSCHRPFLLLPVPDPRSRDLTMYVLIALGTRVKTATLPCPLLEACCCQWPWPGCLNRRSTRPRS